MKSSEYNYNTYRPVQLLIGLTSLVNVILIYSGIDRSFFFSAFVPTIATTYGQYYFEGSMKIIATVVFGIMWSLLFVLCWFLSKYDFNFMFASAVIYTIDTAVLFYFIYRTGYSNGWLLEIIIHLILVVLLFLGGVAGIRYFREKMLIQENEVIEEIKESPAEEETAESSEEEDKPEFSVETQVLVFNLDDDDEDEAEENREEESNPVNDN